MKEREFIISLEKMREYDDYKFLTIKEKAEPLTEEEKDFYNDIYGGEYKKPDFYLRDVTGIYNGEFYEILFTSKNGRYNVYLVKELKSHYTYRGIFGGKRHATKRTGYEVFYHRSGTKSEMNLIYKELFGNIFKAKNGKYFTKIKDF